MSEPMETLDRYAGTLAQTPSRFETRDGYCLASRLIRPDDAARLIEFFEQLSTEARWRRFRLNADNLDDATKWARATALADVDNRSLGGAVLALDTAAGREQIVGVARLARLPDQPHSPEAEAAVVVRDDFQGRGVGSELLRRTVLLAKQMGVQTIIAIIEADNEAAMRVFRRLDLPAEVTTSRAETEMRIAVPS